MDEAIRGPNSLDPASFAKVINRQGYPFHYGTLKAAHEAADKRTSRWLFQVSEFPIEVRARQSRIDYVLQANDRHIYLVVECKRANPKLKRWCFAPVPYVKRNAGSEYILAESIIVPDMSASLHKDWFVPGGQAFHIALEMKIREGQGDEEGSGGKGAIEDAATQVSLGLNGLIEFFRLNPPPLHNNTRMIFIPVIVTTAQLVAASVDMGTCDIETGELDSDQVTLTEKEWLFYQYPVSPGIRHSAPQAMTTTPPLSRFVDLGTALEGSYLRSIAVVQGNHIAKFLSWFGGYVT
jgi:hypothetical protein